jgi:hypothetical protein
MEGYAGQVAIGKIQDVWRHLSGEELGMLQWKPKLVALVVIAVIVAAVSGQFTWDSFAQFTWF